MDKPAVYIGGPGTKEGGCDSSFIEDMRLLCSRLGIEELEVLVVDKKRNEYASNVHGYGKKQWDLIPFTKCDLILIVSWRLCADPEFRRIELPKLEAAMADVLRYGDCFSGVPSKRAKAEAEG